MPTPAFDTEITPAWLRRLRAAAGASQPAAAARIGVHKRTWSAWERGFQSPGVLSVKELRAWHARLLRDGKIAKEVTA